MTIELTQVNAGRGREFPTLGSSSHPVSTGTLSRFFVTGPFTRTEAWASATLIATVHAKEVGTSRTICGMSTQSWSTLWEVPFDPVRLQGACPACRARVASCESGQRLAS